MQKNCKILKYYFFLYVLVPHAKQFSKDDNPVSLEISLNGHVMSNSSNTVYNQAESD